MAEAPTEVSVGLRFFAHIADEKALWEAREPIGKGYWICKVIGSWDFLDQEGAFHTDAILGALHIDALFGGYKPEIYSPAQYNLEEI